MYVSMCVCVNTHVCRFVCVLALMVLAQRKCPHEQALAATPKSTALMWWCGWAGRQRQETVCETMAAHHNRRPT
jgi:hypothetical protein